MTADTTLAPSPTEREQDLFEAVFPMPPNCTRFPGGYAATAYSAWAAHTFCDRWEGWKAARRAHPPAPQGPALVPLTGKAVGAIADAAGFFSPVEERVAFISGLRHGEAAHGITGAPNGKPAEGAT